MATGRRPGQVEQALGEPQENLLVTKLDITSSDDARDGPQARALTSGGTLNGT